MSLFRNVKLIRRKRAGGSYVKGQWQTGEASDTVFYGSWQPARGKTLELLPEGKRSREVYRCFAPLELNFSSADEHGEQEADQIIWEDKEYEVTSAAKWNNGLIPNWELLCTRPKAGET